MHDCIENIRAISHKLIRSFCVAAIFLFSSDSDASITLTAFIRRKATARCPSVRLSVWLFRGCSNVNAVIQRRPHTASVGLRFNRLLRAPIQPAGSTAVESRFLPKPNRVRFHPETVFRGHRALTRDVRTMTSSLQVPAIALRMSVDRLHPASNPSP